ncbi:MAG: tRNA (N6-threonylcarbamoyladenosine(37)-N6)-methyltransferase TrmO [Polyangia bacterium]|jgi:tRNA-Thr(GGU) m(6)t(6)A37 methyltransferase TsaA|nr:tRNA (N6-threonylcarbamoyladenosine(37)-N6)-methyltransferase TrmO [Polyangia bacterium]
MSKAGAGSGSRPVWSAGQEGQGETRAERSPPPVSEQHFTFWPIGVIRSPFLEQQGTPIQPTASDGAEGLIEVFPPYQEGLADLDGFERIWLLYVFDRAKPWKPRVLPYRDQVERGLFSTRAPARPCAIGLSAVELMDVKGALVSVRGIDVLDGTPLLDLKPYVPEFDAHPGSRAGWLSESGLATRKADDRFVSPEIPDHTRDPRVP